MQVSHKKTDRHIYTIERVERNFIADILSSEYKILIDGEIYKYYDSIELARNAVDELITREKY